MRPLGMCQAPLSRVELNHMRQRLRGRRPGLQMHPLCEALAKQQGANRCTLGCAYGFCPLDHYLYLEQLQTQHGTAVEYWCLLIPTL